MPSRVSYTTYSSEEISKNVAAPGYMFRNRRSILLISQDPKSSALKVEAAPYELTPDGKKYLPIYTVKSVDDARSTTQIKATYVANTQFLDQVQVTTKDNIADTINKIGTVAASLAPIIAASVAGTEVSPAAKTFSPTTLDPADAKNRDWQRDPINVTYCLRIQDVTTEQGLSMGDYLKNCTSKSPCSSLPISACSTGVVEVAPCANDKTVEEDKITSIRVTFATDGVVVPVPLPSSGAVKMNAVCGASVTEADKEDRSNVLDYLNQVITNVNTVQAALKKKK